ncbi:ATP-binding protein [Isoptericola croceus]|uniref:ATP-binding protein n=1 Tax=Isoptericola croceus TaxID=3031406 RepID=UPI0023F9C1F9|nr:AAA family ATPase [Isoptericola croceus]
METPAGAGKVEINVLGRFEVVVGGVPVPASAWPRPQAASLVKVLALAPGHRLHREQLIDRLWPDLTVAEAAPRLHKLAHYARRALGDDRSAVALRGETVTLLPDGDVVVDADTFAAAAAEALAEGSPAAASVAADLYTGPLLPDDPYQPWTDNLREHLRARYHELLRTAGRWDDLLADDPADEVAHLALMTQHVEAGDHRSALRQFERMNQALRQELGVGPGREARALRDRILADAPEQPTSGLGELVGRRAAQEQLRRLMADVRHGRGRTVFVTGPPGVGKSALLEWLRADAERSGWRTGHGVAAMVEGAWPYAPVLDALADLFRRHPTLLDGLDDTYRAEIERALAGEQLVWSGESTHQRLFVAAAELLRLAAAGTGLVLTVDEVHEADEASLRLLHFLARRLGGERLLLVVGHRQGSRRVDQLRTSLLRRGLAYDLPLEPIDRDGTEALVRALRPDATPEVLDQIWEVSAGLPFAIVEMAGSASVGTSASDAGARGLSRLGTTTREALQRVAVIGTTFDTDQFVVLTGLPEPEAFAALNAAETALVVLHTGEGYRFRHRLVRDALLDDVPPVRRSAFHRQAAERLSTLGAPPARIAHHLIAGGRLADAVPHVLQAVQSQAAVGAYRDALALIDAVREHARPDDHARLLALRANLLAALGDRSTVGAYRAALAVAPEPEVPLLRARMAQAAVMEGDLDTAGTILDGLEPTGGPADVAILLAKGNVAYLNGDVDAAWKASDQVGGLVRPEEDTWQRLDLLTLQALIAHQRGEIFTRLRVELRRAHDDPALARTLYDPYLCVAEYLLYGTTPYSEVRTMLTSLLSTARRSGVPRAEAFATAVLGEAALLAGDLDEAERQLGEAVELYRDLSAPAGEASTLQRLAELRLEQGDRIEAERLLRQALPRARWSMLSLHLIQRILGTLIRAARDPAAARAVVDEAADVIGREDRCLFCDIMLAVPAAIACADVGDLDDAREYVARAEQSSVLWEGTAWQAAVQEARAHLAQATNDLHGGARMLAEAAVLFDQAGQPLDAQRCRAKHRATSPQPS